MSIFSWPFTADETGSLVVAVLGLIALYNVTPDTSHRN